MTPCRLLLDDGLTLSRERSPDGQTILAVERAGQGPGLGHALALMSLGALAASFWWVVALLLL